MTIAEAESLADDMLEGAAEIAAYLGKTKRQVDHLLETGQGQLPAFKLGGKWHMRKSRYRRHIEQLETAAVGSSVARAVA